MKYQGQPTKSYLLQQHVFCNVLSTTYQILFRELQKTVQKEKFIHLLDSPLDGAIHCIVTPLNSPQTRAPTPSCLFAMFTNKMSYWHTCKWSLNLCLSITVTSRLAPYSPRFNSVEPLKSEMHNFQIKLKISLEVPSVKCQKTCIIKISFVGFSGKLQYIF